jgi:hypothetical protein
MKKYIYAMSIKRRDLGDWIDNHTFQVMVALAQLYLFPSGNRVHWRKEVWEKFSRMYRLKHSNKLPSADFILQNSWVKNKHNVNNALNYAIDKEDQYTPRIGTNYDEFYQIVEDYFMWIASQLSSNDTLRLADVKEELDSLGLSENINE